ncbi:DUF4921 family protein [candidate division KSB1 bacterium]
MPELRKDPILGRWIIISTRRAARPNDFKNIIPRTTLKGACPFCMGNEEMTPPNILTIPEDAKNGENGTWRVRVVSNKYPALRIEGNLNKMGDGIYDRMNGIGAHEVVIETPRHELSLTGLDRGEVAEVVYAYKLRMVDLKRDPRFTYGMLFKNVGQPAGASVEHTHSQLIVLPTVPKLANEEMDGSKVFYDYRGRCLFCDMIRQEIQTESRIIFHNRRFVAFCPFASRFPFEIWILPLEHESHFENISAEDIPELSEILLETIRRLESALKEPSYNFMVHTTPFNIGSCDYYHWHIEIIPRVTRVAGFEWGTDFYINPVPPEKAAGYMKDVE